MYKYSPDTLNIPVSGQYGVAFKFGNDVGSPTSGQWEYIVAYSTSNPARTYINRKINNSALWSGWDAFITNSDFRFDNINKYVLDWGNYGNGTHQLKSSIVGKTIYVSVGANGRITSFWGTSIVGDYRDVIIPDGVLSIHIDSETQITVSGATPEWMLRGIVTL